MATRVAILMNFDPKNRLEELLVRGDTDPTARPAFYRELLASNLFLITEHDESETYVQTGKVSDRLVLPVFSSVERLELFAQKTGQKSVEHCSRIGRSLLHDIQGGGMYLNVMSEFGMELTSQEILEILDGSFWRKLKIISIADGEPIAYTWLGSEYHELLSALVRAFSVNSSIKRAYVVQISQPSRSFPQLVIGVESIGPVDQSYIVSVAQQRLQEDQFLTFINMSDDEISNYLISNIAPFYLAEGG
jgi:hypothetical protein